MKRDWKRLQTVLEDAEPIKAVELKMGEGS